ncbi:MAG: hypothetical protein Q9207_002744 [Kuettlingeria erythrocarpa]
MACQVSVPDDIPRITSGDAFYRFFVLGDFSDPEQLAQYTSDNDTSPAYMGSTVFPASATNIASTLTASAGPLAGSTAVVTATVQEEDEAEPTSWRYFPYPNNTVTAQPNLGFGGVVTGYFLNDDVTAVLSIPSFDVLSDAILTLSDSVGEFIRKSREAGKERMIIDLQRNGGVGNLLATDVFKQVSQSWSWG